MNSVNIVYLFGVLCILVSPSFTAPPIASPNASVDEIFQKLIRDGIEITSGVSHVGADGKRMLFFFCFHFDNDYNNFK